jgi:hypothetical protein
MKRLVAAAILLLGITPAFADDLPDHTKTPGVPLTGVPSDDPKTAPCLTRLVGHTVRVGEPITLQMLCHPDYSTCIRDVKEEEKKKVYESYGLAGDHTGYCSGSEGCEIDHLISLELGGSNDQKNLWPQPYQGTDWNAHVKDHLENRLKEMVCKNNLPLAQAQKEISTNWIDAYKQHIGPTPSAK